MFFKHYIEGVETELALDFNHFNWLPETEMPFASPSHNQKVQRKGSTFNVPKGETMIQQLFITILSACYPGAWSR